MFASRILVTLGKSARKRIFKTAFSHQVSKQPNKPSGRTTMSKPKTLYIGSVNHGVHTLVTPILGRVLETLHEMIADGQADWAEIHQEVMVAPNMGIATFTEEP